TEPKHYERMSVEPVAETAQLRASQILAHRNRIDIADAASVEIAGARVMNVMAAPPKVIGRKCQRSQQPANPIVQPAMPEEGSMTAVVLNQEEAQEKAGCRH